MSFIFTGAKAGGAAGFFKGLGKGVVGVVARPAGGLVDFASSTFEGIKGLVTFQNLTPFQSTLFFRLVTSVGERNQTRIATKNRISDLWISRSDVQPLNFREFYGELGHY